MNDFDLEKLKESFKKAIVLLSIVFLICSFDWLIEEISSYNFSLKDFFAVLPKTLQGILGIPFSFFFHADLNHLLNNSLILLVGLTILFSFYENFAYSVLFMIIVISQVFIWIFGADGRHIGASGVAFGLITFIASVAIFVRTEKQLLVSFFVIFFFGGAISAGMLPQIKIGSEQTTVVKSSVSYAGHWGGVIAGLIVSYYSYRKKRFG